MWLKISYFKVASSFRYSSATQFETFWLVARDSLPSLCTARSRSGTLRPEFAFILQVL